MTLKVKICPRKLATHMWPSCCAPAFWRCLHSRRGKCEWCTAPSSGRAPRPLAWGRPTLWCESRPSCIGIHSCRCHLRGEWPDPAIKVLSALASSQREMHNPPSCRWPPPRGGRRSCLGRHSCDSTAVSHRRSSEGRRENKPNKAITGPFAAATAADQ
jgi:hypothetical protein